MPPKQVSDYPDIADHQRRGAIAENHLILCPGTGAPGVAGDDKHMLLIKPLGRIKRCAQSRRPGPLRGADIDGRQVFIEVQGCGNDASVLTVLKWKRRRAHVYRSNLAFRPIFQTITRGFDRHGDTVFIPVADTPFTFAEALHARLNPAVCIRGAFSRQPQPRYISTKTGQPNHSFPPDNVL